MAEAPYEEACRMRTAAKRLAILRSNCLVRKASKNGWMKVDPPTNPSPRAPANQAPPPVQRWDQRLTSAKKKHRR
jgi:hypothetical protein